MHISEIRNLTEHEVIDYVMLMSILSDYANPRDKISRFIKANDLIRVKKGLYVFGPSASRGPCSLEVLANLVYGPSVVSLEYALSWYSLIPERVSTVTSVTPSRNKLFKTPVGTFSYTHQNASAFVEGATLVALGTNLRALMTSPEKALADVLALSHACPRLETSAQTREYLIENLRIDEERLGALNLPRLRRLERVAGSRNVGLLRECVESIKEALHA